MIAGGLISDIDQANIFFLAVTEIVRVLRFNTFPNEYATQNYDGKT